MNLLKLLHNCLNCVDLTVSGQQVSQMKTSLTCVVSSICRTQDPTLTLRLRMKETVRRPIIPFLLSYFYIRIQMTSMLAPWKNSG